MLDELAAGVRAAAPRCGAVRVVAVDGGAGAGKTTLAGVLAERLGASLLHTDRLLDGWAGQFTFWDRLRAQVLDPLSRGLPGRYRRYSWARGAFADWVDVAVPTVLVVEGVSSISACGAYASTRVLVDVARPERERRWAVRDGGLPPEARAWLDAEDVFFAANPLPSDVVVLPSDQRRR